jgi:uncharacterized protein (TIGR03083 family)
MMTTTPTNEIERITRTEAHRLALDEFARFAEVCASLDDDDWARPTDCTGWDVRAMALHILGSGEAQASPRELMHQFRRGLPLNKQIDSHHWVDGLNELQLRDRAAVTNAELAAQLAAIGPKAVKGRWRTPPPIRWLPVPFGPPVGVKPLKYLLDVGFTRDVWMHRIDVAVALGRPPELTAEHDGRIVADIVAEWAAIHRQPFELDATGSAGGSYRQGDGGEHVTIDAIELCRTLAGRVAGTGVLANPLPL